MYQHGTEEVHGEVKINWITSTVMIVKNLIMEKKKRTMMI